MKKIVAIVAVVALLLGSAVGVGVGLKALWDSSSLGGSSPERLEDDETSGDDVTSPPEAGLAPFYSQLIAWQDCGGGFDCGWLKVPLDYADPEGEQIELRLLKRDAATGERIGSLVVNPGGPGAPGTEYAAAAQNVFRKPILDHFDIVGFDPRGTGASSPIDCLSDADLDAYVAADPAPDTPAGVKQLQESNRAFFAGCREKSGALVDHVSTVEVARDMDVLRAALGQSSLDYFGASYGTALGATYAELFPERVGHFVLDGAVDVSADTLEKSLVQAGGFETALRAYVKNCVDSGDCRLGDSVDEGMATISDLIERISRKPLPGQGDRKLTAGLAFYGVVMPLYNRAYWPMLDLALAKALDGDGSGLLETADLYTSRDADGYRDNSLEAIVAINCLDDPEFVPASEVPARFAEFEKVSPTFGKVFAWGLTGCAGFDGKAAAEELVIDGKGAAPILVVGTTRDPATPMVWAEELADQLDSGVLVRRDGDGHTAYNAGNNCVDEVIEDYLLNGKVPEDGVSC
ncbi:alpha/beta hydrolase [Nocardioides jishulii]|uniref:Alpha/beta hydrolase n=1 Tax=Nocardioides jishulii TaxID=2575440 RepID=A0A4U2YT55_9ACTN|nr:alpha/beta hydrolase [Nocardioides jishulii]QCX28754.1 alpha/beta hydrolase [Nocardioides jishulii]TKI64350.1 alpha/beta hydrolase [Nocardioides jishulii]